MDKVISIHIPKTAGTSFRKVLEKQYGKRKVFPYYMHLNKQKAIPARTQVIHGHITVKNYKELIHENPEWANAKIIVWIREPSERLASNYFYLKEVLLGQVSNRKLGERMVMSFEQYINSEKEANRMSKFFNKEMLSNKNLLFIGETEHFHRDLKKLSALMGWEPIKIPHSNKTNEKDREWTNLIPTIKANNTLDYEIYELAQEFISRNN
jgi:hypothetical protein